MPPDEQGAPASAPAEGGAQTTPSSETTPSTPEATYDGLGNDFDDLDVSIALPSESEAGGEKVAEPTPEVKPPETVPPGSPEPAKAPAPAPTPAPPPPPAEGPKETQAAPVSPPSEPRTLVEQLGQHRAEIITELAKTRFAWDAGESKQFTEDLETDATKALLNWTPVMMSRIYYEATTAALNHINQFVPVLMANYTKALDQQKAAETAFFGQFPQLSKDKHWNDILQFAGVFGRQPNISQEDLLAMVGAAVMAKNKLVNAATNGVGQAPPRKQSAPAFVPAQAGGSAPVRVTTETESPYGGLGGDYED